MVAGTFAKWYVAKLRAKPFVVNVTSGFLLMSTGDVLAQRVEVRAIDRKHHPQHETLETTTQTAVEKSESTTSSSLESMFLEATDAVYRAVREEIDSFGWDKSRTAKMAAWSFLFAPFYMGVFKMYDRYLPKKRLPSIASRVLCSFLVSIPINFAFYTYGNLIEHTAEWYEERKEQRAKLSQLQIDNHELVDVPYRFDKLVEKTQLKLEAEFVTTIKTSASFWIPLNFLSFTVVPTQYQPLNLMFFSVFWNCYLSMSQHREVKVDDDETKK